MRGPSGPTTPGADVCRFCGADLDLELIDLGEVPLANSYLRASDLDRPEPRYPLRPMVWIRRRRAFRS